MKWEWKWQSEAVDADADEMTVASTLNYYGRDRIECRCSPRAEERRGEARSDHTRESVASVLARCGRRHRRRDPQNTAQADRQRGRQGTAQPSTLATCYLLLATCDLLARCLLPIHHQTRPTGLDNSTRLTIEQPPRKSRRHQSPNSPPSVDFPCDNSCKAGG